MLKAGGLDRVKVILCGTQRQKKIKHILRTNRNSDRTALLCPGLGAQCALALAQVGVLSSQLPVPLSVSSVFIALSFSSL